MRKTIVRKQSLSYRFYKLAAPRSGKEKVSICRFFWRVAVGSFTYLMVAAMVGWCLWEIGKALLLFTIHVATHPANHTALFVGLAAVAAVVATIAAFRRFRQTEFWRMSKGFLAAKKDQVCWEVEFVDGDGAGGSLAAAPAGPLPGSLPASEDAE